MHAWETARSRSSADLPLRLETSLGLPPNTLHQEEDLLLSSGDNSNCTTDREKA